MVNKVKTMDILLLNFGVFLLAEPVFSLNNNGDCVRAKIPLAVTDFLILELGVVATEICGKKNIDKMNVLFYNSICTYGKK